MLQVPDLMRSKLRVTQQGYFGNDAGQYGQRSDGFEQGSKHDGSHMTFQGFTSIGP
jgi:hypothetical protein